MTPVEQFSVIASVVGALSGCTALGRHLVTHGGDRQRLGQCEGWIKDHGVELGEFKDLIRRVEDGEKDCVPRREHDQLVHRVDKVEGEVTEVSRVLTDIRVAQERISTQLDASKDLVDTKLETISHRVRNVQQALEGLARQHSSFNPATP